LNGKIDIAQAEAIADLIDAGTTAAARAAVRSLQGEFSARITDLKSRITSLRAYVEAAIDFPDEEIDFLSDKALGERLAAVFAGFESITAAARQGALLREGLHVVIAGKPNAGKSSLLNKLAGDEVAIVTDVPGTTRDVLRQQVHLDGLPLNLVDTAGAPKTKWREPIACCTLWMPVGWRMPAVQRSPIRKRGRRTSNSYLPVFRSPWCSTRSI
jgi:tRNA modification GTPase